MLKIQNLGKNYTRKKSFALIEALLQFYKCIVFKMKILITNLRKCEKKSKKFNWIGKPQNREFSKTVQIQEKTAVMIRLSEHFSMQYNF